MGKIVMLMIDFLDLLFSSKKSREMNLPKNNYNRVLDRYAGRRKKVNI